MPSHFSTLSELGVDSNTTIGALLVGGLVSAALWGITSTQTVIYYQRYWKDCSRTDFVVLVLWILDCFQIVLVAHVLYWYLVSNYGNGSALASPTWSIVILVLTTSITEAVVRGMFTIRVWKLSNGSWLPTMTIALMTAAEVAVSIAITKKIFHATFRQLENVDALVYFEFASGFFGDLLTALCLCYFLHKHKTGFKQTENMLNVLMAYVINTGLFTTLASCTSLILFAVNPMSFVYIAVYFQHSKLYTNACLAMLNARETIRERSGRGPISVQQMHFANTLADCESMSAAYTMQGFGVEDTPMAIQVKKEIDSVADSPRPYGQWRTSQSTSSTDIGFIA